MIDSFVNSFLEFARISPANKVMILISLSAYIAVVATLIYFFYKKQNKLALKLGISYVAIFVLVEIIKRVVGRLRPDGSDLFSFPSRHAVFAFFIAATFPTNRTGKIVLYSWATLVGLSRLILAEHWLTDVLFGAGLGLLAGIILKKANNNTVVQHR